ncbi:hypothetical protein [Chitinophaga sp.]|uniref:hypothetical protein n=1 Tax=Chitinophaga sp. TaxID=1869181 RepID=UPI0031CF6F90
MKTQRLSRQFRKMVYSLAFISGLALVVASCKKDEDDGTITSDEMAEAVSQTFSSQGGGLVVQTNTALSVVSTIDKANSQAKFADYCGYTGSKTMTSGSTDSAKYYIWSYGINWTYKLTCIEKVPSMFEFQAAGKALYDFPRMSSDDSVVNKITVTNLVSDSTFYKVTQTYTRVGTQQSKIGKMHKFTSTVFISSSNMKIDKTTLRIVSGTATVNISGASSSGKSFSLSGNLTFSGNDAATLVMNDTKYTVSWIRE